MAQMVTRLGIVLTPLLQLFGLLVSCHVFQ